MNMKNHGLPFEYDKEGTDQGNCLKFEKTISV